MRSILFGEGRSSCPPLPSCLAAIDLISSGQTIKQQTTNQAVLQGRNKRCAWGERGVATEAGEAEKPQKLRDGDQIQKLKLRHHLIAENGQKGRRGESRRSYRGKGRRRRKRSKRKLKTIAQRQIHKKKNTVWAKQREKWDGLRWGWVYGDVSGNRDRFATLSCSHFGREEVEEVNGCRVGQLEMEEGAGCQIGSIDAGIRTCCVCFAFFAARKFCSVVCLLLLHLMAAIMASFTFCLEEKRLHPLLLLSLSLSLYQSSPSLWVSLVKRFWLTHKAFAAAAACVVVVLIICIPCQHKSWG